MSASEKLEELNAVLSAPWGRIDPAAYLEEYPEAQRSADLDGVVKLRNALPQIVAVVEAAEQAGIEDAESAVLVQRALAALDEALEVEHA